MENSRFLNFVGFNAFYMFLSVLKGFKVFLRFYCSKKRGHKL